MRIVRACLLALGLAVWAVPSNAQPAMSRGQQVLQINSATCLNRAAQALRAVGFSASASGDFVQGFRDISGAYIVCNDAPGGSVINIFVASGTNDSGVPGRLRQLLQAQMQQPGSPVSPGGTTPTTPGTPATPTTGSLKGNWNLACCKNSLKYTLVINQQQSNSFSGYFDGGNGNVTNGQVRGNVIEFDRSSQHWSGQLVTVQGKLQIVNGNWTGAYADQFKGQTDWHAEKQ